MDAIDVESAKEIHSENGVEGTLTLWKDGKTTICLFPRNAEVKCYTSEDKVLYYIAQAFYSGMGHEIRGVPLD